MRLALNDHKETIVSFMDIHNAIKKTPFEILKIKLSLCGVHTQFKKMVW